jgi:hypothetical protein
MSGRRRARGRSDLLRDIKCDYYPRFLILFP